MAASPGSSSISMLWPDIVGYQHEKVHTGVLRTLLNYGNGPTDPVRVVVARGLTRDKSVVAVEWADQEQPLVWERPRRVLDLAAELRLSDGSAKPLAVETKVDSSWQAEWLQGSAPADAHGCLLAVGLTGLAASAESLAAVLDGLAGDAHWEQEARVSGLLRTHWLRFAWDEPGLEDRDAGVFVQFMAEGERRSLCVKVYDNAVESRLAELQEAFAEALDGFALARVARPASRDGSCTVGRQVLEPGADPGEVRRRLLAIESRVLEVAGAVFRRVLIEQAAWTDPGRNVRAPLA